MPSVVETMRKLEETTTKAITTDPAIPAKVTLALTLTLILI